MTFESALAAPVFSVIEAAEATGKNRRGIGRLLDARSFDGADFNSEFLKIHLTGWSSSRSTALATYSFNDCMPYRAAGKFLSYPATVRISLQRRPSSACSLLGP